MSRRVLHLEVCVVAEDYLGIDDESIRLAVALAASQAARKYAVATRTTAVVIRQQDVAWEARRTAAAQARCSGN